MTRLQQEYERATGRRVHADFYRYVRWLERELHKARAALQLMRDASVADVAMGKYLAGEPTARKGKGA